MPLCETLRIAAGRKATTSLFARAFTAAILVIILATINFLKWPNMEKPKNTEMENYVFMEQDEIQLLYPLSISEGEIFEYIEYLDTILKNDSKVRILNTELSVNLFLYLREKNIELYVPESIYNQIEKLSLNSQEEDTKYSKIYKYEEDFI